MEDAEGSHWLCFCSPFTCFQRKYRKSVDGSIVTIVKRVLTCSSYEEDDEEEESQDPLEVLKNCFSNIRCIKNETEVLQTKTYFIKRCVTKGNPIMEYITNGVLEGLPFANLVKGIEVLLEDENEQESSVLSIGSPIYLDLFSEIHVNKDLTREEITEAITEHLTDKYNALNDRLKDLQQNCNAFEKKACNQLEDLRDKFLEIVTSRGGNFKLSKSDFQTILKSSNPELVDEIFETLDKDDSGVVDWGQFELNCSTLICGY
ncbi:hypothetical protein BEWA_035290 [Theileria equi strain WA]|uniref:EF-hand domain-containing protein n=1 Tax=Theileria equi strain WA TaxID=1537102 RepID=L1LE99_THEEQ|nr:hypothetical protein BEWA_035290 [Theileria equi strain WA]EKX73493.1 hypothetical protein BEWA_035290 [Theileria equi strain WA]|eukprot:XP_004832945.1 hypothetical protein BEWA_035290 [Theileria equi strain WA]